MVGGEIVCPSPTDYSPCTCTDFYGDGLGVWLNCLNKNVDDDQISLILNSFLSTPGVSPLKALTLFQCRLNRIPDQLHLLDQLVYLNFEYNNITSIDRGAFNFSIQLEELDLIHNRMVSIEPGAFQGKKWSDLLLKFKIKRGLFWTILRKVWQWICHLSKWKHFDSIWIWGLSSCAPANGSVSRTPNYLHLNHRQYICAQYFLNL